MWWKDGSFELFLLLLLLSSITGEVVKLKNGDSCAKTCSHKENIYKFDKNTVYVYNFVTRHSIKNPNAKQETLQLELRGKAQLSKITDCDFGLLLSDVTFEESIKERSEVKKKYNGMKGFLEKYPLRFGFDDGRITGVCPSDEDHQSSVDIKKAVISAFQLSLDSIATPNYLIETDISGDCITEYTAKEEAPNFVLIYKKKSISGCSRKTKYFSAISGIAFEKPKETRNMALLDGDYNCKIKVKKSDGLKESICEEKHLFKPFGSDTIGSTVVINQELYFDTTKRGIINAKNFSHRFDLTMFHEKQNLPFFPKKKQSPKSVVQNLCLAYQSNIVSAKITDSFVNLIKSMSDISYEEIKDLHAYVSNEFTCRTNRNKIRTLFIDALANVKSGAAFKFLTEDAHNFDLSRLGYTFFEKPTISMITNLAKKLQNPVTYNTVVIIISSMIKSFCVQSPKCMENIVITKIMNLMTTNLDLNCNKSDENSRIELLHTLRGLSNIGSHPNNDILMSRLKSCVPRKSKDDDIRVYLIQVVRQFPCDINIDTFLWAIFEDIHFSAEIRIEAYLSLVRCPTRRMFGQIIQMLNTEQSEQLGSFTWSHITNLMETSNRFKTDVRDMLQIFTKPMKQLEQKFNLDFRSYSKNIEKTFKQNDGAIRVDTNLIFSSTSPIPSSATVNATIEVFGRAVNLFEFGIRGKGIGDAIFNRYFKPVSQSNVNSNIAKMDKRISKGKEKLNLSLYTKLMGREVYFNPNIVSDLSQSLLKPSLKHSFERSMLLVDTTVSVATISGFPVEIQIDSAGSVNFNMVRNKMISFTDIELAIISNYGLQITGRLLVNAFFTKIGVQSKGTLSRDFEFGGKLKLKQSLNSDEGVDVSDYQFQLNKIPDDSKLISISNELSLIHQLDKLETAVKFNKKLEKCTGESIMKIMGLQVCVVIEDTPNLSSYLSNIKAEVAIKRFDGVNLQLQTQSYIDSQSTFKSLIFTISHPALYENAIKFYIDLDQKLAQKTFKIVLGKKTPLFKLQIEKNNIVGEFRFDENSAKLYGKIDNITEIKVSLNTKKGDGEFYFRHLLTKDGFDVSLRVSKHGEYPFGLQSKTTLRSTSHKLFKEFYRFRHSTLFKYSENNEMSILLESSKGNNPNNEVKLKFEFYWKTMKLNNFYINQAFLWQTNSEVFNTKLFGKVPGTKFTVNLFNEIEVKEKKFNISNSLVSFISDNFFPMGNKPAIFFVTLKRSDNLKNQTLFDASSRFCADVSNLQDVKILLENKINFPSQMINRYLNFKFSWKLNHFNMYDIESEIVESKFLKLTFNNKFTDTQSVITSAELTLGKYSYKIVSDLKLPKSHVLLIMWSDKKISINSEIHILSFMKFNMIVSHILKINDKVIFKIENSAYNNHKNSFLVNSIAKSNHDSLIYNITSEHNLKYHISVTRIFNEFLMIATLNIPSLNVKHKMKVEQFLDIDIKGNFKFKNKTLKTELTVHKISSNTELQPMYGFNLNLVKQYDVIAYNRIDFMALSGTGNHTFVIKWGKNDNNILFGVAMNLNMAIISELNYKFSNRNRIVKNSVMLLLNVKNNPSYNCYCQANAIINYGNMYSFNWGVDYGKSLLEHKVTSSNGLLAITYKGRKHFEVMLSVNCSGMCKLLTKLNLVSRTTFKNKENNLYQLIINNSIEWQKTANDIIRYWSLQGEANIDLNLMRFDKKLTFQRDANLEDVLAINIVVNHPNNCQLIFKTKNNIIIFVLDLNINNTKRHQLLISLKTSNKYLKEVYLKFNHFSKKEILQLLNFTIDSNNKVYKMSVERKMLQLSNGWLKRNEEIKWDSNIPFIATGLHSNNIDNNKNDVKLNVTLVYNNTKVFDFIMDKSKQVNNLLATLDSNFHKRFTFRTLWNINDTNFRCGLKIGYDKHFMDVSKLELMNKVKNNYYVSSVDVIIKSSVQKINEISLYKQTNLEIGNLLRTLQGHGYLHYNGKLLHSYGIDLKNGILKMKSSLIKLGINIDYYSTFRFKSLNNFTYFYKLQVNDKMFSEFNITFFKITTGEKPRSIDTYKEVIVYFNLQSKYQSNYCKVLLFQKQDKRKLYLKMDFDVPQIGLNLSQVNIQFENVNETQGFLTGFSRNNGVQYHFAYKFTNSFKQELKIKSTSKSDEIILFIDFTSDYLLKFYYDKTTFLDFVLKSIPGYKKSGKLQIIFFGRDLVDVKIISVTIIPSNITNVSDFLCYFVGIKHGFNMNVELDGSIIKNSVQSKVRLYHLKSVQYGSGTLRHLSLDVVTNAVMPSKYFLLFFIDESFPKFNYNLQLQINAANDIIYKNVITATHDSFKNISFVSDVIIRDLQLKTLINNDNNLTEINFFSKDSSDVRNLGLKAIKSTYELSLDYLNRKISTNLGNIIRTIIFNKYLELLPDGKEYYIIVLDSLIPNKFELRLTKHSNTNISFISSILNRQSSMNSVINVFNWMNVEKGLGIKITGESPYDCARHFMFTLKSKINGTMITVKSVLNLNKRMIADLITYAVFKPKRQPYTFFVKCKGLYIIFVIANLDTNRLKFNHNIDVKNGKFKTMLWSSISNCSINSEFECNLDYANRARIIKIGIVWKKYMNIFELYWNKRKEQGFRVSFERIADKTVLLLLTPLRMITITKESKLEKENMKTCITLVTIRNVKRKNPTTVSLTYFMTGSIKADYNLDIQLNSNLMGKGLQLSIVREVSLNVGKIYTLNIKSYFIGESQPFLSIDGYLCQLSQSSYEFKVHAVNNNNIFTITSAISVTYEETSFEYIVLRNEKNLNTFIFQFIPMKKLLLTNNKDLRILFDRIDYQYGHRGDVLLKLGKKSPNITAYSTFTEIPFKYYAEVIRDEKKFVVHFRPIGENFVGDIYRKISGRKIQDIMINVSESVDNVINTNVYWNPNLIENIKSILIEILKPDNWKTIMTDAYEKSENQIAAFAYNVQNNIINNMNRKTCLEFVNELINDMNSIPNTFANSYDNDDWYIKTAFEYMHKYLSKIDIIDILTRIEKHMKYTFEAARKTIDEWTIGAKMYTYIYNPLMKTLKRITYMDVKVIIKKLVNTLHMIGRKIDHFISRIGTLLELFSERVRVWMRATKTYRENIESVFNDLLITKMVTLLGEIKRQLSMELCRALDTEFIKQLRLYYTEFIGNLREIISIIQEMNLKILNYLHQSSVMKHVVKTFKLISDIKYKDAFLNVFKPNATNLEVNLEAATANVSFYLSPVIRQILNLFRATTQWLDAQVFIQIRGSGFSERLLDLFYKYEYFIFNYDSVQSLRNLVPPFKKIAWVINGNSILTFDGSSIRIGPGNCSYLLARDTQLGSFSLLMHIKSNSNETEFELLSTNKISLLSSRQVKIDGKLLKTLPKYISNGNKSIEIYRNFDMLTIRTSDGIKIEYFVNLDYMKLSLIGNWHGMVKGLMGSNDFEILNDWAIPSGRITHDAGILSKSWTLNKCLSKTKTGLPSSNVDNEKLKKCIDIFKLDSVSYLRRCFNLINPEPYFQLCQLSFQYRNMSESEFNTYVCDLTRNYVVRCKSQGLMIRLTSACVKCGSTELNRVVSTKNFKNNPKFNFVFIIEQSTCLIPYKGLLTNIYEVLKLENGNLYTLLSFNGLNIFNKAHFKSFETQISTKSEYFDTIFAEFLTSADMSVISPMNISDQGSQAIYNAIKMPSKAGYIDRIIFIGCSKSINHNKHIYSVLGGLLKKSGILMTYLTMQTFTGDRLHSDIVGIGNDLVYYFDRDILKSRAWRKNIQPSNDVCSSLAQLTRGTVWSLSNINSEMKQRRVAEELNKSLKSVNDNLRQKCICRIGIFENGNIECRLN